MAIDRTSNRFGHRSAVALVKTSAIVFGLIAIGYVAVTAAEYALPHAKAATDAALKSPATTPRPAPAGTEPRLSSNGSPARVSRDDERRWTDGSRECRPDAGIVTECIFN